MSHLAFLDLLLYPLFQNPYPIHPIKIALLLTMSYTSIKFPFL